MPFPASSGLNAPDRRMHRTGLAVRGRNRTARQGPRPGAPEPAGTVQRGTRTYLASIPDSPGFHSRTYPAVSAVASSWPSGLNATPFTAPQVAGLRARSRILRRYRRPLAYAIAYGVSAGG